MPITDHDLRALFVERSESAPPSAAPERLAAVQGRIRTIRHRRTAAASLAAVLLVGAAVVAPGLFGDTERRATTIPAQERTVDPIPDRPEKLAPWDNIMNGSGGELIGTIRADEVGAKGKGTMTLDLPAAGADLETYTRAPGIVATLVNDVKIQEWSSDGWTVAGFGLLLTPKGLAEYGLNVKTGDEITVRVQGSDFTVAGWKVEVREAEAAGSSGDVGE